MLFKNEVVAFITPISYSLMHDDLSHFERRVRAKRSAFCAMKGIYFLSSFSFGIAVVQAAPWFPAILGGTGAASAIFEGYPYQDVSSYPLIRGYLMIQLGYQLFSLLTHVPD
jgi:hypothetical protein